MHPLNFWSFVIGTCICISPAIAWIVLLTVLRFNHVGRVISGDECPENADCSDDANLGYMTSSGMFLKVWVILVYTFVGCSCIKGCMDSAYNSGKINWGRPAEYFEKYERVSLLGVGAVGTVWKVKKRNPAPGEEEMFYAAKEFKNGPVSGHMFPNESKCMQELDHEGLIKAVDVFGEGANGVIIMPIIKGDDFNKIYQKPKDTLIPKKELIEKWITMTKILEYFHS